MTPPETFVADLTAYDPKLRCRFSRHRARFGKPLWIIERRVPEGMPDHVAHLKALDLSKTRPKKLSHARTLDLWEGMREGYAHVMDVHPSLLSWSQVAPTLTKADAWRQGGMEAIARQHDEQDAADEARRERHATNVIEDRLQGVWDSIRWANKQRVNVPVEVKQGFVVTDRRTVAV